MSFKNNEPLAIVGIGCRFPGNANDPQTFWQNLVDGKEAIREVPSDRWNIDRYYDENPALPGKMITKWGGFIDDIDQFDAHFFGISPREALRMDPQQRWLLETTWEAFEDGGLAPANLRGSNTGVFVGISSNDYANIQMKNPVDVDVHTNSGSTLSIASGRISYLYDFKGPSISVDTACSSALVAVNLACNSIWENKCDMAVACGVNALLTPDSSIGFSKASMLSPSGKCFAFDARANGYVRGEGAGSIILRPLSKAIEDGNNIYATIRASIVNQDGNTSSMTVPGLESQEAMLEEAYLQADLNPSQVAYMEAHGTGTPVGDPIETNALGNVLAKNRSEGEYCIIGSVKSNIGHLESASGIAGIIKAACVLKHKKIPPNLNFKTPNPDIPFEELKLRVPTSLENLPKSDKPAIAAVNSFGFGGTNAHVVLEEAPQSDKQSKAEVSETINPTILAFSGKSEIALKSYTKSLLDFLSEKKTSIQNNGCSEGLNLTDLAYSTAKIKSHHEQRAAIVAHSLEEASEGLQSILSGQAKNNVFLNKAKNFKDNPVFVFTGQGPQWWGMGRELLNNEPVFRKKIEACDAALKKHASWSLIEELKKNKDSTRLNETQIAQPAIFALQVSLAELWKSWGVTPSAVVGHSVGEAAAAYLAGLYDLEQAIKVIFHRSRLQQKAHGNGRMYALGLSEAEALPYIEPYGDLIEIAAVNSPSLITLSGDAEAVEKAIIPIQEKGVFCRSLGVDYAFHSFQMDEIRDELLEALASIEPTAPAIPIYSTVSGELSCFGDYDAKYWWRNVRHRVRFADAITSILKDGQDLFLELGPHPSLSSSLSECINHAKQEGTILHSLKRNEDAQACMAENYAKLYTVGQSIDSEKLFPKDAKQVDLPAYTWDHKTYWLESEESKDYRLAPILHPLLGLKEASPKHTWCCTVDPKALQYLTDHRLKDSVVFPASAYVEMALAASREIFSEDNPAVESVEFVKALFFPGEEPVRMQFIFDESEQEFEIFSTPISSSKHWDLNAKGRFTKYPKSATIETLDLEPIQSSLPFQTEKKEMYEDLAQAGYQFGPCFREVENIKRKPGESLGKIAVPEPVWETNESYCFHPAILDACFQCIKGAQELPEDAKASENMYLPVGLQQIRLFQQPPSELYSHAQLNCDDGDILEGDITVYTSAGETVAIIKGFRAQKVQQTENTSNNDLDNCLYEFQWKPVRRKGDSFRQNNHSIPNILDLVNAAKSAIPDVYKKYDLEKYVHEFQPKLEELSYHQILQAFYELGWNPELGNTINISQFESEFKIIPTYHRLLESYFEALTEENVLQKNSKEEWEIVSFPQLKNPDDLTDELAKEYPSFYAQVPLIKDCGKQLANVLTGKLDPLHLIFSQENSPKLEHFYKEDPQFLAYNELIQKNISALLQDIPEYGKLRILEIGAGTGSLTEKVISVLPENQTEYTFTDISPLFVSQAKNQFSECPFMEFAVLDIQKDPSEQGLDLHSYDLILATNVIHATSDISQTLSHIRQFLSSEGTLIFLEVTKPLRALNQVFGLTEGWWHYKDTELRPHSALMPRGKWETALRESGFSDVESFLNTPNDDEALQTVFIARAPEITDEQISTSLQSRIEDFQGAVLLFLDESGVGETLANQIESHGGSCLRVKQGEFFSKLNATYTVRPDSMEDFEALFQEEAIQANPIHSVIHLWSLDHPDSEATDADALRNAQNSGCVSVTLLAQQLIKAEKEHSPRVHLVTQGAQSVGPSDANGKIASSPLIGLLRVANNEHIEFQWTSLDFETKQTIDNNVLLHEIGNPDEELEVAWRNGIRYAHRLAYLQVDNLPDRKRDAGYGENVLPYRLEIPTPGILKNLCLRETERREPGPNEVEIRVSAVGVNFRDVMKVLGIYPGNSEDLKWLGDECSGTVVRVGNNVTQFKKGDSVTGMVPYCCRSYVSIDQSMLFPTPNGVSHEEAATLPIVFLTAHYALNHLARLQTGESILIHAATGGVGQAAIQVAQLIGAEVFATAGSPEKREFLRKQGIKHVMDSRSLNFADEIMEITNGKGVDAVLNSLAGDFIPKSIGVLAHYGRFLEIGKVDIYQNSKIGLSPFKENLSFFAIDLSRFMEERPAYIASMLDELSKLFEAKKLKPLPYKSFPVSESVEAFRYMAQAKHIGKNVLSFDIPDVPIGQSSEEDNLFVENGTYLITGGLGGFGLAVAQWMTERGAKHLVLMGRSGVKSDDARETIKALEEQGVAIVQAKGDVTKEEDLIPILEDIRKNQPPLKGILHAAMVLDDAFLTQLTPERVHRVLDPKMTGAWHLHNNTLQDDLDYFILFSSASSMVGGAGQGNYSAANFFLDSIAQYRHALGLPALAMNWGALAEAGYVARNDKVAKYLENLGLESFTPKEALEIFARVLPKHAAQIGASRVDWSKVARLNPATANSPTYRDVAQKDSNDNSSGGDSHSFRPKILSAPAEKRLPMLIHYIAEQVAQVFGSTNAQVDRDTPLTQIGLDSLMSIELMNRLESSLGISLPMGQFLQGPTITELASPVLDLILESKTDEDDNFVSETTPAEETGTNKIVESKPLEETFALSTGQQALWFLNQLAPDNSAYNLVFSAKITPSVDIPVMEKAFAALFKRHPLLDVTFNTTNGIPQQTINHSKTINFREHDVIGLNDQELKDLLVKHANEPFDLQEGPVIRLELFKTEENSHVTLLSMHHIISDAWSVVVLMNDLMESYFSYRSGIEPKLEPMEYHYQDYVRWHNKLIESAMGQKMSEYWRNQLDAAPMVLELPTDHPRPPAQTFRGATYGFRLNDKLTKDVLNLSAERNVTLYTTLLSAFNILLHRYCNQDDLLVGSPFAGRQRPEFHNLVGYFINPVALRSKIDDDPTFLTYLERTSNTVISALENQDLPLSQLVDELEVERDPSRSPVFQVTFSMERIPGVDEQGIAVFLIGQGGHNFNVADIEVESIDLNLRMAQFEISLVVEEANGQIYGCWQYNRDLFEPSTIEHLNDIYQTVLENIVTTPDKRISEYSLLPESNKGFLLDTWNATAIDYPSDKCIHQLFENQVGDSPYATAVSCNGESLTYQELNERANGLATQLVREGIEVGDSVGIFLERSTEMLVSVLAVLKSGAAYLPLDPAFPSFRIQQIVDNAKPKVIISQRSIQSQFNEGDQRILTIDSIESAEQAPPAPDLNAESLAYIIYTSGSTGTPKGVEIPHKAAVNFLTSMQREPGVSATDKLLAVTTLSFDISVLELLLPLFSGAEVIIATQNEVSNPQTLSKLIENNKISIMQATPATWLMLLESGWSGNKELKVLCGGEALPLELASQLVEKSKELWNMYGPTETTVWSTISKITADTKWISIGQPIANTTTYILDENHNILPVGCTGSLYIGGDGLARSYHKQPDLTEEKFVTITLPNGKSERLYNTGDLARFTFDRKLELLGRTDHQVKLRGFRIELGDIEEQLTSHPKVCQATVTLHSDTNNKQLIAYIVKNEAMEELSFELKEYLSDRLPHYMHPAFYVELEQLPLTPNKKIDRTALPVPEDLRKHLSSQYQAPRSPSEVIICDILNQAFNRSDIGITDNFFELGGHSLMAVQVQAEISKAFNREVPVTLFMQHPSAEALANHLDTTPEQVDVFQETNGHATFDLNELDGLNINLSNGQNGSVPNTQTVDAAALAYIPDSLPLLFGQSTESLYQSWFQGKPYLSNTYETPLGNIGLIILPLTGSELYRKKVRFQTATIDALHLAKEVGAQAVSLTGLIPSASNYGADIIEWAGEQENLPVITTGHATTTATVVRAIENITQLAKRPMENESVAIVGLGSIGRASLRLMLEVLPHPESLILCDLYQKQEQLEEITSALKEEVGYKGNISIETTRGEIPDKVYTASLIIGATNVPGILDINRVSKDTLIVDDSFPPIFKLPDAIFRIEKNADVMFTTGGLLRFNDPIKENLFLPQNAETLIQNLPPQAIRKFARQNQHEITGCILSSLLTSKYSEISAHTGLPSNTESLANFRLLEKLDIQAAQLQCEHYFISEEQMDGFFKTKSPSTPKEENLQQV